jgi:hypothetical protein
VLVNLRGNFERDTSLVSRLLEIVLSVCAIRFVRVVDCGLTVKLPLCRDSSECYFLCVQFALDSCSRGLLLVDLRVNFDRGTFLVSRFFRLRPHRFGANPSRYGFRFLSCVDTCGICWHSFAAHGIVACFFPTLPHPACHRPHVLCCVSVLSRLGSIRCVLVR